MLIIIKKNILECIKAATQLQNFSLVTEQRQIYCGKPTCINYLT